MAHDYNIGDIVYSSWGYDQTNVDWYQVVALAGKTQIVLHKLAADVTSDGPQSMTGKSSPIIDQFVDQPFRRRAGSCIKITDDARARKWDGNPKRCSSYC